MVTIISGVLFCIGLIVFVFTFICMVDAAANRFPRGSISTSAVTCGVLGGIGCMLLGIGMRCNHNSTAPCNTTATRTYSCGKGGTCTETTCLDNYKLQRQPSGNPVQVDSVALIESSIKYSGGNQA